MPNAGDDWIGLRTFQQYARIVIRSTPCRKCEEINTRRPSRLCDTCFLPYHLGCGNLTRQLSKELLKWTCPTCRQGQVDVNENEPVALNEPELLDRVKSQMGTWKKNIKVLKRVPKGARVAAAEALSTLLENVNEKNDVCAWVRLFGFSYSALRCPSKSSSNEARRPSLATRVRHQINDYLRTLSLPSPDDNNNSDVAEKPNTESTLGKRVSSKLADFDIKGAVRLVASDDSFAGYSPEVTAALQGKHPPAPDDLALPPPPDETTPAFHATKEQVMKALSSFHASSASGPDGLRPGHFMSLTSKGSGAAGERLKETLTDTCNLIISGKVPETICSVFYGASLCALSKKGGGIRPIAVGNTLRRLASKVVMTSIAPTVRGQLEPSQLGVGTRAGCEAALRATRHFMDNSTTPKVILKIDLKNAFNCIRRDKMLSVVRELIPEAYHLFYQTYSIESLLFHGESVIASATGLQQGDPAGPALFALTIDDLVKSLTAELNAWFLDDGTIGDVVEKVLSDLDLLKRAFPELGEEMNDGKCELFILNHNPQQLQQTVESFRRRLPTIQIIQSDQQRLLGSALTDEAVPGLLEEKHEEIARLTSRLQLIEPHLAMILLKNCFSLPKLMYILRTSAAFKFPEHLRTIDNTVRNSLSAITNVEFDNDAWHQASLPVRHGGLGIRRAEDIAPSAFLASHFATESLVVRILENTTLDRRPDPQDALRHWQERVSEAPPPADKTQQRGWDEPICRQTIEEQNASADQYARARLLAAREEGSGAWLHALPSPALGTLLDPDCLRIAVALRVGARICEPHKCRCGAMIDSLGYHPLSCRYSAGRHPRHASLNDIVKRALTTAGIPCNLEPPGLDRGDGRRPDGMTVFAYRNGMPLVWDATCVDTFAASYVVQCAVNPAHAANQAEQAKIVKYRNLTDRYLFQPISVETTGVFGSQTRTFLKDLGRKMSTETGDTRETAWLQQRLSIAVIRGNAYCITAAAKHL